ncbi:hypothetical protein GW17_00048710, partial [Ensete ventricosum]
DGVVRHGQATVPRAATWPIGGPCHWQSPLPVAVALMLAVALQATPTACFTHRACRQRSTAVRSQPRTPVRKPPPSTGLSQPPLPTAVVGARSAACTREGRRPRQTAALDSPVAGRNNRAAAHKQLAAPHAATLLTKSIDPMMQAR